MTSKEELAQERVENTKKRVAHALNLIEVGRQELGWACESMNWDDEILYELDGAATKLGFALATLVRWNDIGQDESEI